MCTDLSTGLKKVHVVSVHNTSLYSQVTWSRSYKKNIGSYFSYWSELISEVSNSRYCTLMNTDLMTSDSTYVRVDLCGVEENDF